MGKRICVYCASSNRIAPQFVDAAILFARLVVTQGHSIVCGGTAKGLMSALIGATIEAGGHIEGVVPAFMVGYGWDDKRLTHITVVETMWERKQLMMQHADAVVALPGAIGTLEELSEAISLKRLGKFDKPIIILNQERFYDSLLRFFDELVEAKMMGQDQLRAFSVVHRVEDILPTIDAEPPWMAHIAHYHDSDDYGNR